MSDLVGFDPSAGLKALMFLLRYTIPQRLRVPVDELRQHYEAAGIDLNFFPRPVSPVDAFRRATSRVERKRIPTAQEGITANLLVREVVSDDWEVVRHLIQELRDTKNVRLSYDRAGVLSLDRKTGELASQVDIPTREVEAAAHTAQDDFAILKGVYEGEHIRRSVTSYLAGLHYTSWGYNVKLGARLGGTYLIPGSYAAELQALGKLFDALKLPWGYLKVTDPEDVQREAFQAIVAETTGAITAMADVLKDADKQKKSRVIQMMDEAKRVLGNVNEYEGLVNRDLSDLRANVELISLQMEALLEKFQEAQEAA
ncbi:MAG: DUF6744 family protein [Bacillota bacterium]